MTVNDRPDRVIRELAIRNGGMFTEQHARTAGLSAKQTRARRRDKVFVELYPGVMCIGGTAITPRLRLRAALEFAGTDSRLARLSAGECWTFDGVKAETPEVLVPYERHPSAPGLVVLRSKLLPPSDCTIRDGLPITTVNRTIIDVASVLTEEALEIAVESARRQGHTSIGSLAHRFESLRGAGRSGAARLGRVLAALDERAPSESALEVKTARLLRDAGLTPVPQFRIKIKGRWYRVDFAWPDIKLILECDGLAYHTDFRADRPRWSALGSAGWRVMFVTWRDVTRDPDAVIANLAETIASLTKSSPVGSLSRQ